MRKIKFRGKTKYSDNSKETWIYGDLVQIINRIKIFDSVFSWDVRPETVGQFTGLSDKKGDEIYEGDVVKWIDSSRRERIDFVEWKNGGMILRNGKYAVGVYLFNDLEIIGNIHDNPELLK
jgi:uncharacterized phage protein (TIGR01671 family)